MNVTNIKILLQRVAISVADMLLYFRTPSVSTTYVTGYWHVPDNQKHSLEHYLDLIPETLSRLKNHNVILYCDEPRVVDLFKTYIKPNKLIIRSLSIKDLPTYYLSEKYFTSCTNQDNHMLQEKLEALNIQNHRKEKGIIHYRREYL